jgi:alkyldihydroxyacetonephosphate synthase
MKRWNGWGNTATDYPLAESARDFLRGVVGPGEVIPDATYEQVLASAPPGRIPPHPLLKTDAPERLTHSLGQSLSDWLALRHGRVTRFTDAVAYPNDRVQVAELIALARSKGWAVVPYGGGSSVLGHLTPAKELPTLTIDLGRMDRLMDLNEHSHTARLEAGVAGPQVEELLNARGYTLGHFPQSFEYSTVGGWVATRSVGQQSYRYGRVDEMLIGCDLETPAGPWNLPAIPASAAGPDIRQLVLGSEGRLGVITSAVLRVHPMPEEERFLAIFFPDWQHGADAAREITQHEIPVSMLRLADATETMTTLQLAGKPRLTDLANNGLKLIGMGGEKTLLIYGLTGTESNCRQTYRQVQSVARRHGGFAVDFFIGHTWQKSRFLTPYLRNTLWEAGYALDTLETCLDWNRALPCIAAIKQAITAAVAEGGERSLVFGHLSHMYPEGASCYVTYLWRRSADPEGTLATWKRIKAAASGVIVAHGGTISHQHGVGTDHKPWLEAEKGRLGLELLKAAAHTADPLGMMNPGKLI